MGAVYLAEDIRFHKPVAIKENLDSTPEAKQQFEVEAQILAALKHTVLPRVFDYFQESSGRQYLAMDYVEGNDLQEMIERQGALPEQQVVPWMLHICDALAYLHGQRPHPVIHRDIKPGNIKITPDGSVALVDFGIAKVHHAGQKTVRAARAATPGYSPPEQYGPGTDARSDIYALGATIYHLLTGTLPPESITLTPTSPLPPPHSLNRALSPAIERIILKAMALDPNHRYQSALEMKQALAALAQPKPSTVAPAMAPASLACPRCGTSNRARARFCQACSSPLALCHNCGAPNRPGGKFCGRCGRALALPYVVNPAVSASGAGHAMISPRQPHEIAAWMLLGLGGVGLPLALWWPGYDLLGAGPMIIHLLAAVLSLLAVRDLLNLGARYTSQIPSQLRFLLGDRKRGRRLGIIAAVITAILGVGQAWLILPLILAAVAAYAVWALMSQAAVTACGNRYTRPAAVTLIGWGLIGSGVGALPGVALLLSKPWAKVGAIIGLAVMTASGVWMSITAIVWGFLPPPSSTLLSHEASLGLIGGALVRPYALTLICYGLALTTGSLLSIRYLRSTAVRAIF
jgi:serine/threonine-protein kinase